MSKKLKFVVIWFVLSLAVLWVPVVLPQFQSPSVFRAIFGAISLIVIVLAGLALASWVLSTRLEVEEKEKPIPSDDDRVWMETREFLAKHFRFDLPKTREVFAERRGHRPRYLGELQSQLNIAAHKKAVDISVAGEGPGIGPREFQNQILNDFTKAIKMVSDLDIGLRAYADYQYYLIDPPTLRAFMKMA